MNKARCLPGTYFPNFTARLELGGALDTEVASKNTRRKTGVGGSKRTFLSFSQAGEDMPKPKNQHLFGQLQGIRRTAGLFLPNGPKTHASLNHILQTGTTGQFTIPFLSVSAIKLETTRHSRTALKPELGGHEVPSALQGLWPVGSHLPFSFLGTSW